MKTVILLTILLLALFIYHVDCLARRQGLTLSERFQKLTKMSNRRLVMEFNSRKFRNYVQAAPRNYSVIIMFTSLAPQRQCMACRGAYEEFKIVANSYQYTRPYSKRLFFATIDFDESYNIFQMMNLNTDEPVLIHFPSKGKPRNGDSINIQNIRYSAKKIAQWIAERTDIQIRVMRPPNTAGPVLALILVFGLSLIVAGFFYLQMNYLKGLYNEYLWGIPSLFFCFAMVSGQMWNYIRGPSFIGKKQNGQVTFIDNSSRGQLILETYIVMLLNAAVVLGIILLTEASRRKNGQKKNKLLAVVGLVILSVFFSLLLSIFRTKSTSYPYHFLFK